jgi:hypothetical protein
MPFCKSAVNTNKDYYELYTEYSYSENTINLNNQFSEL